jgi:hypothetical protein
MDREANRLVAQGRAALPGWSRALRTFTTLSRRA